ncbi:MAG: hypothetical protein RML12_07715 [Xanthomonadales bacterium]|nr:hypothetical protein [Xanthomonadales bacterium]
MRVTVFGAGYVGLVSAACLAEVGNQVVVVEVDPERVALLAEGGCPIFEPGLPELLEKGRRSGRLRFTDRAADGVGHGEFLLIAVGTPPGEDGSADLSHVLAVARAIGTALRAAGGGDRDQVHGAGGHARAGCAPRSPGSSSGGGSRLDFEVVSNPEFLKEGAAVQDFLRPDRIVLGSHSDGRRSSGCGRSMPRSSAVMSGSWSWTRPPRSSPSTPRTRCSRRASAS